MELIDIGCNLTHDSFDGDRQAVLLRAREAGVVQMIVTGASEEGSRAARKLALDYPGTLFATAGVHPHHATTFNDASEKLLRDLSGREGVVAVGETGLDYFRDFSPRDVQRDVFLRQLEIGINSSLPLFLHMRDAHADFYAILREARDRLSDGIASPAAGANCGITWTWTVTLALPAGSVTNGAAFTCMTTWRTSRSSGYWSRPMRLTLSPETCGPA
jgi:TatD DNase family protein